MTNERSIVLTDLALTSFRNNPLSKVEGMILWHLASTLPAAGDVVSNAELGQLLSITRTAISQSVKRLRESGFLLRGARLGLSYHYKLNPAFFRILS